MKQTVEEAAREYASTEIRSGGLKGVCGIEADKYESFLAGAKWMESQILEHTNNAQDRQLSVTEAYKISVESLKDSLERWVHGAKASNVVETFEAKLMGNEKFKIDN